MASKQKTRKEIKYLKKHLKVARIKCRDKSENKFLQAEKVAKFARVLAAFSSDDFFFL